MAFLNFTDNVWDRFSLEEQQLILEYYSNLVDIADNKNVLDIITQFISSHI